MEVTKITTKSKEDRNLFTTFPKCGEQSFAFIQEIE